MLCYYYNVLIPTSTDSDMTLKEFAIVSGTKRGCAVSKITLAQSVR